MNRIAEARRLFTLTFVTDRLIDLVHAYQRAKTLHARIRFAEELIEEIAPPLKAFICTKCPSTAADDVSQETVIAISKGLRVFRGKSDGQFRAWCFRIAACNVSNHFRAASRHPVESLESKRLLKAVQALESDEPPPSGSRIDVENAISRLERLNPRSRLMLHQRYVLEWDIASVGRAHGLSYDAARMAINRSLAEASKLLEQFKP